MQIHYNTMMRRALSGRVEIKEKTKGRNTRENTNTNTTENTDAHTIRNNRQMFTDWKKNTSPLVQKYNFKQQGGRQEKEIMPIDLPKQKSELWKHIQIFSNFAIAGKIHSTRQYSHARETQSDQRAPRFW